MSNPFVSVIIPTFNRSALVIKAIDSVLNQSYQNIELIIVDDGSTDDTNLSLSIYKDRIKVLSQKNSGVSSARNKGVQESRGDWVAFLDSDDTWQVDKLEKQVLFLNLNPDYRWIHCDEVWIRNGVRVNPKKKHAKPEGDIFDSCLALCCVSPSAVMIKKDLFLQHQGFREDFPVCEDYDLWLKLSEKEEIGFLSEKLVVKTGGHDDQLSKFTGLDLYRLKALKWQLDSGNLTSKRSEKVRIWLKKRFEILSKGYQKHNRHKEQKLLEKEFLQYL